MSAPGRPVRVVIAPDSFKESMTAAQACAAMERGVRAIEPDADVVRVPLADGGEGTAATLVGALGGQLREVTVDDALGHPRTAQLGWVESDRLAIIEAAQACGLEHIPPAERDVLRADTFGVGQMIREALDLGARRLIIGLGGTATNDAGAGMLRALGVQLRAADRSSLPPGGAALADLDAVSLVGLRRELTGIEVRVACDVDNPLLGERGASAIYGPQKGASPEQVQQLDRALTRFADVIEPAVGRRVRDIPGAGAAGGLAAALLAVTHARLESGASIAIDATGLDEALEGADLCLTGEGAFDAQSAAGKVPVRVAERAREAGVPTVVLAGRVDTAPGQRLPHGIVAAVPITPGPCDLTTALREGPANLEAAAAMVLSLLQQEVVRYDLAHPLREDEREWRDADAG